MKRFAMKQLQSWKEKGKRKPMIIMGARLQLLDSIDQQKGMSVGQNLHDFLGVIN